MKRVLVESDSDSEVKLSINNDYAKQYNAWREKEEFQKLKDRYGTDKIDENSSSSDDDEENPEEIKNIFEKDFFRTLSYLKKQDPCIYDSNVKFFNEKSQIEPENQAPPVSSKKENKPLTLRDYERKIITERNGILSDDEEDDHILKIKKERPSSPTIVEEQKAIKDSFKDVLESDDENDSGDWGGLFKQRKKTEEERKKEDDEYLEWLKGQKDYLDDKKVESDLKHLHVYWNDPKLDSGEAFLRDYVLNKRYLEPDDKEDLPSYNEIIQDSDENLSEDENTLQQQDEFEHKYNFRFEEPDKDFIKRYPRTMENSLRRKDDRRKRKREEVRERKEAEKAAKREEIKQLKALKRKEIMEKIEKLKQVTGNSDLGFKDEDLEEDFNPEEYDKRMSRIFNDDFYGEEEGEQKPEFPDLDEELEIERWDKWKGHSDDYANGGEPYEPHCEDPDFNMDCDYNPKESLQTQLIESTKKRKKHRQSKFAELVAKPKPVFDPKDHTFDEYVDEYYKLDFEDIIGDLPCRFKYRKVIPNDFGLTIDEILRADDRELNRWCSLKKAVQHRSDEVEKYEVHAYRKKATNEALKRKILTSLYVKEPEEPQSDLTLSEETESNNLTHKDKNNKKWKSQSVSETSVSNGEADNSSSSDIAISAAEQVDEVDSKQTKMKKKKKKFHTEQAGATRVEHTNVSQNNSVRKKHLHKNKPSDQDAGISDARLKAYGINPKKFKNKLKYSNKKNCGKRSILST